MILSSACRSRAVRRAASAVMIVGAKRRILAASDVSGALRRALDRLRCAKPTGVNRLSSKTKHSSFSHELFFIAYSSPLKKVFSARFLTCAVVYQFRPDFVARIDQLT